MYVAFKAGNVYSLAPYRKARPSFDLGILWDMALPLIRYSVGHGAAPVLISSCSLLQRS